MGNHVGGVMVSVLASSAVDRGFQWASSKSIWACWSGTKRTSSLFHWKWTCSRHDVLLHTLILRTNEKLELIPHDLVLF
jgi:hypothetical protein